VILGFVQQFAETASLALYENPCDAFNAFTA
jgi:hypothetical protein